MNDETHKLTILIAAAIFAARALTDWDGKFAHRGWSLSVANAVEKAKFLVSMLRS